MTRDYLRQTISFTIHEGRIHIPFGGGGGVHQLLSAPDRGLGHLPRFSTITSGAVSKTTVTARPGSQAKGLYKSFSGTGYGWADIDESLLCLAVFQGETNAPRVELVIDLRQAYMRLSYPRRGESKGLERNLWIQTATK